MTGIPGSATISNILDGHGSGGMAYRLEIEGWPCEWSTDERIAAARIAQATNLDGRASFGGLSYEGLRIRDRVIMARSDLQCDAITFRIVPPWPIVSATVTTDECIAYLAREKDPQDELAAALTYNATSATFRSGSTYASGIVMHLGTEAIRSTGSGNFTRAIWGSRAQAHPVNSYDHTLDVKVYTDIPPTMEGRRVTLNAYGDNEADYADSGTVIWCGVVSSPPSLDRDGITWLIECEPVTHILNQDIAGKLVDAHPIGIYHHNACPFVLQVRWGGDNYVKQYTAHDLHEAEMVTDISTLIDSFVRTEIGASAFIDKVELAKTADGGFAVVVTRSSTAAAQFQIGGGSPILGFFSTLTAGWSQVEPVAPGATTISALIGRAAFVAGYAGDLQPDTQYYAPLSRDSGFVDLDVGYKYQGAPVSPLGLANATLNSHAQNFWNDQSTAAFSFNAWRIYVDADLTGAESVYIPGTGKPDGIFEVAATGTDSSKFYIDLKPVRGLGVGISTLGGATAPAGITDFLGFLGSETRITVLRTYAVGGLEDFVAALKTAGRDHANAGDTPFITDADLTTFTPLAPISPLAMLRVYVFAKKLRVSDVLKEECKFINHFMRIETDGTIGIVPLPRWTEATPVDEVHTLDSDSILTPPDGEWPGWTPNRDGRTDVVELQHLYSFREDKHVDNVVLLQSSAAIPVTKGRGKQALTIKPYSVPLFGFDTAADDEELKKIGEVVLNYFAINYSIVTVTVPYSKFYVMCGDIVSVTSPHILAGDGTKGVVDRRGVVIERSWNMDPARPVRGELTIMLTSRSVVGYAPSAYVTNAVNITGNVWRLTCASTASLNIALASTTDGQVLKHFAVGDYAHIQQMDTYTVTTLTGIVTARDLSVSGSETITIAFDDVFNPTFVDGAYADFLILEFQPDDGTTPTATSSQRRYAYVSGDSGVAPDGGFARRLS